uniref:Peptidase S1 domain-containing protein n=1 Tax=Denticeps clupeoides TaxID=299321 RepID=A0AAY4BKY9_9TELE
MLLALLLLYLTPSGAAGSRIFGGREAKPHSWPYMVSLQVNQAHVCGGVLIRKDLVLTAAHCAQSSPSEVLLGAHNISRMEGSQQRIRISEYHKHSRFPDHTDSRNPRRYFYDIMLLKLGQNATLNEFVKVFRVPNKYKYMEPGTACTTAGWGKRVLGRTTESVLYEASLRLDSNKNCGSKWQSYYNPDHMACSVSDGKEGFCQGDSGGPLVCDSKLYGIVIYTAAQCDDASYPEVYTRVSYFLPWIKEMMRL